MSYASLWVLHEEEGFTTLPRPSDLEIYMKALLTCANGDGRLTQEERQWVLGIASAMGLGDEKVEQLATYEATEDLKTLLGGGVQTGKGAPRSLIYNALRTCLADGELHESEYAAVHQAAAILGVPKEVVGELKAIVLELAKLRQRRLDLVFPEGIPY